MLLLLHVLLLPLRFLLLPGGSRYIEGQEVQANIDSLFELLGELWLVIHHRFAIWHQPSQIIIFHQPKLPCKGFSLNISYQNWGEVVWGRCSLARIITHWPNRANRQLPSPKIHIVSGKVTLKKIQKGSWRFRILCQKRMSPLFQCHSIPISLQFFAPFISFWRNFLGVIPMSQGPRM